MNKNRYNSIIKDYNKLEHLPSREVKTLIKKYPYAHSLHLILGRAMLEENPIEYEKNLSNIAANVLDRATLYQLVNRSFRKEKPVVKKVKPVSLKVKSQKSKAGSVKSGVETREIIDKGSKLKLKVLEPQEKNKPKKADFLSWLNVVNEKKTTKKLKPRTRQEKRDVIEYVHYQEEHMPNIPSDINKAKDFLESQIKALKGKRKTTITKEEVFASESLAQIYLKQRLYKKAIEIYKLLNLKFPKKSTYFASRIKEIRKKK